MVKVTIEGAGPRLVTVSAPQEADPARLIEQRNGQRVSIQTCRALELGQIDPWQTGEAGELLRWLWEIAGQDVTDSERWNGLQAAAWIATNDLRTVRRLGGPIEFAGDMGGRPFLHPRCIVALLRWEIAEAHCRCGSPGSCLCLDEALGELNAALWAGDIRELGQHSTGPVTIDNARQHWFSSTRIPDCFRLQRAKGDGGPIGFDLSSKPQPQSVPENEQALPLPTDAELRAFVRDRGITSQKRFDREQRDTFGPDRAMTKDAAREWFKEHFNPSGKQGRISKSDPRARNCPP